LRIGYFIGAYGAQFLGNEIHEEIGQLLRQAGHEFEVLVPVPEKSQGHCARREEVNGIAVHRIPLGGSLLDRSIDRFSDGYFRYPPFLTLLRRYVAAMRALPRFDVLHVEGVYPLGAIAAAAGPLVGVPLVTNIQGADIMCYPEVDYGYGRFPLPRLLTRFALRQSAAVRANSPMTRRLAVALGASPEKVAVVPRNITGPAFLDPAIDLQAYRGEQREALRARYGVDKKYWVGTISRLHPFKGIEYLLRAVPFVLERLPEVGFLVCGPSRATPHFGDYRTYLEREARRLGVEHSVLFTGEVDYREAKSHLAAIDVHVVPSVVDALNKVVIEAAAVGTPSVVSRTAGISDYLRESGTGVVVEPKSPEALGTAIVELLEDQAGWSRMSRDGLSFVETFRSDRVTDGLLALYEKAVRGGSRAV
jgi:glycosyltransferase involved in cell wall biosynthesis